MRMRAIVPLILLLFLPIRAHASPEATVIARDPVRSSAMRCDFAEDALSLVVTDQGREVAREDFCSAYGRAGATVVHGHRNYVLLEYQEGRGTNAGIRYITIYRLIAVMQVPDILPIIRIPISWATGPTQRFTYEYRVIEDQSGGLQIRLADTGTTAEGSLCCLPPENVQTIRLDAGE